MTEPLTLVDLCCGVGGTSLGCQQAGFMPTLAVDADATAIGAYRRNFPNAIAVNADLADLHGGALVEGVGLRDVTLLTAAPPAPQGPVPQPGDALREACRLLLEITPRYFLIDLPPAMLERPRNNYLRILGDELRARGYEVVKPWLLDASAHGAARATWRVYLAGARDGWPVPAAPRPAQGPRTTVREAIEDLESLAFLRAERAPVGALAAPGSEYALAMRGQRREPGDRGPQRGRPPWITGATVIAPGAVDRARYAALRPGMSDRASGSVRLDPNRPAPPSVDSSRRGAPAPIHYSFPRVVSAREAARLHSLPDWFQFDSDPAAALAQVDSATPPRLARAAAAAVRESAAGHAERATRFRVA